MKTVAIRAISAWLVQMFEVAFSRRICCSRVDERQAEGAVAARVLRFADQAAGHLADEFFLASR